MRPTKRLTIANFIAMSMLAACNAAASPSAVASLAGAASPPAELLGKTWKLTSITETTPAFQGVVPEADQSRYTIEFHADGTFNATADCNQVGGTYAVSRGDSRTDIPMEPGGGSISILPGASTLAACPPGSLADRFVIGLGRASSFGIESNELTINLGDGTLKFSA